MNILLTSVGRRTYLIEYFRQALAGIGKVYASNSVLTYSLLQADGYVLTPNIYDESYISFLLKYCQNQNIQAVISLFDIDLPVLAKNKSLFEQQGITIVVSDYRVTQICNDKWQTYNFLLSIGLKQKPLYINLKDAQIALAAGTMHYPVFVKPRWGMGSIGIYKVENDEELGILYNKLHREIFHTYLKYESSEDVDSCIVIQEAIMGQEHGIEVLNDLHGNYVATFAKKKIAMRSGETDIAESEDSTQFETIGKTISKHLGHIANLDVDCFVTDIGDIYILEMNCRFGGQYPFTHNAGVNVPLQIIKWLSGEVTDMSILTQNNGVKSCKEITPVIF